MREDDKLTTMMTYRISHTNRHRSNTGRKPSAEPAMTFQSINPTTGEPFATYKEWPTEEALNVAGKVHHEYLTWRRTSFDHFRAAHHDRERIARQRAL